MKICAISDMHGNIVNIPDCDILLISGDITPFGDSKVQLDFLNGPFRVWLESLKSRGIQVVACAGNHDTVFEKSPDRIPRLPWIYLQDSSVEISGVKIYGTPWVKDYGGWSFMVEEPDLKVKFDAIPEDTDILVTHGPPHGYCDEVPRMITAENEHLWPEPKHEGSESLIRRILEIKPKLVVFGHIHPGYGLKHIGKTILVNASLVNDQIELVNEPIIVEL